MKPPICTKHKVEMTFKEGGVSKKSGNAYNSFWGCPEKNGKEFCGESQNIPEKLGRLMSMEHQYTRDKNYVFWSSTNGAIEMVKTKEYKTKDEFTVALKEIRDFFMSEWKEFYIEEIILENDKVVEELKSKLKEE